jgi:hypothetical protein
MLACTPLLWMIPGVGTFVPEHVGVDIWQKCVTLSAYVGCYMDYRLCSQCTWFSCKVVNVFVCLFVCWNWVVYIVWSQLVIGAWRSHFWRVTLERVQSFLVQNSFDICYSHVIWWHWIKLRCYLASNKMQILSGKRTEKCNMAHFKDKLLQGNGQYCRYMRMHILVRFEPDIS